MRVKQQQQQEQAMLPVSSCIYAAETHQPCKLHRAQQYLNTPPPSTNPQKPALFVQSCCTPGFQCRPDKASLFGHSCQQLPTARLNYTFASTTYGACENKVTPGGQCGEFSNCCAGLLECVMD